MQTTFVNGVNPWKPFFRWSIVRPLNGPRSKNKAYNLYKIMDYCATRDEFTSPEVSQATGLSTSHIYKLFMQLGYRKTPAKIAHSHIWRKE